MIIEPQSVALDELRRDLTPSEADRRRVFEALQAQLTAAAVSHCPPTQARQSSIVRVASLKLAAALVGAFLCGLGAVLSSVALRAAPPKRLPPLAAASRQTPAAEPLTAAPSATIDARLPREVAAPAMLQEHARRPLRATSALRDKAKARAQAATVQAASPPPTAAEVPVVQASLRQEIDALRRAEQALRDKQPRVALEILDACARQVSSVAMLQERMAARTVARCSLSPGQGFAALAEFTRVYPRSPYLERVRNACRTH